MLKLSKAYVDEAEVKNVAEVLTKTVMFGMGKHVADFEAAVQQRLGTERDVICVNTGTSALHIALAALDFPAGSEVIVPSITYVASHQAISAAGLKPVSCEVLFPSGHIDVDDARGRVTSKTVAIMPVSYAGADFEREALYQLASDKRLRVVEDNAHAFGGKNSARNAFGADGDITCFSFDGIKNITTGEGGAVVTGDQDLANNIKIRRSLGVEKDAELRYKGDRAWEYNIKMQGFRYHMSNINAAMGMAQLDKLELAMRRKHDVHKAYLSALADEGLQDMLTPTQVFNDQVNYHIFSMLLPKGTDREAIRTSLRSKEIESGFHYAPNHLHDFYRTEYSLPKAEEIGARTLSVPFHPGVEPSDAARVMRELKAALQ